MKMRPTLENLEETLADIEQVEPVKSHNIMTNYDDFIDTLSRMVKVQPVYEQLRKAAFYYRKSNKFFEKSALFSARCEIKESSVSDEDLKTANLQDYITGNILTLAGIEQRLTALGWKG